jgi:ATP-dependent RNA helicase HelY
MNTHPRPNTYRRRKKNRVPIKRLKIKPGADASLKPVFKGIGPPPATPFTPDDYQLEALAAINGGDCLVTAPTGAGKTYIAVEAIKKIHANGGRAWYASPLKALSNAKYEEFGQNFGLENTGILTGDRKENSDAPVIVGTTEILRNQLYDAMHQGASLAVDLVVLDEAHFLGDKDRGVVWEEIMIYLPASIPLLLLSATIGNGHQIARWLSKIRAKTCRVVNETKRPVNLFPLFLHPGGTLLPLLARPPKNDRPRLSKRVQTYAGAKKPLLLAPHYQVPPFGKILSVLRKYKLLPAIFFLKSRDDCDKAIDACRQNRLTDDTRKRHLTDRVAALTQNHPHMAHHRQRNQLEQLAVASHHSGQLPSWKMVVEHLMTEGLLDAVFATSTVAAGVNFPARTVVFSNSDRFNGKEFLPLDATEFHQMTGRAGRRGMDKIGFALALPGKFMNLAAIARLVNAPAEDVISQININFSMVLNLLLSHTIEDVQQLLNKSFAAFLMRPRRKKPVPPQYRGADVQFLWRDFQRHLRFLQKNGFVDFANRLTEDGKWAAQLRIDQPLLVAEGLRRRIFPETDAPLLAAISTALVNERESDDQVDPSWVSKKMRETFEAVRKELTPFAKQMLKAGFDARPLYFRPAVAIYAWCTGTSWEEVLTLAEKAEGDLAMLVIRTADYLRHIKTLKATFPDAAETATQAIELLLRDPIKSDYGI